MYCARWTMDYSMYDVLGTRINKDLETERRKCAVVLSVV